MSDVRKALDAAHAAFYGGSSNIQAGTLIDERRIDRALLAFLRAMPDTVDTTDGEMTLDVYIPWTPSRVADAIEKETT